MRFSCCVITFPALIYIQYDLDGYHKDNNMVENNQSNLLVTESFSFWQMSKNVWDTVLANLDQNWVKLIDNNNNHQTDYYGCIKPIFSLVTWNYSVR